MTSKRLLVTTPEQIRQTAALAQEVWTEHYTGLLEPGQIAYMVEKYQSETAIRRQIAEDGYRYFLLFDQGDGKPFADGEPCGYVGIQETGNRLFLSKLYIRRQARGHGLASDTLRFLQALCRRERLSAIWLTVNKGNASSIAVYQKWGFRTIDTQTADIGGGYVMDDYIMELPVEGAGEKTAMQLRPFGRTGARVSALGFGAMRMPTLPDGAIDEPAAIALIRAAIDGGVNYVDTAYFYHNGKSESLVGKALRDGYRERVYVATKSPVALLNSPEDFDRILSEQLARLDIPYVDFYLFHALDRDEWRKKVLGFHLIPRIEAARAAGKIRHIGFSFHDDNDAFHEIVDGYDGWEFCQIQFNYVDIGNQAGLEGLQYAASKGLGVIVMEPLLGGRLAVPPESVRRILPESKTPVEWALDFVWDRPETSLLLSGMSNAQQVEDNLVYASRGTAGMLTEEDKAMLEEAHIAFETMAKVPCTGCAYCMPCPFGVDIPGVFRAYNRTAASMDEARKLYETLEGGADRCRACHKCEKICPQHIAISRRLAEAHGELTAPPEQKETP